MQPEADKESRALRWVPTTRISSTEISVPDSTHFVQCNT
jgi:hypothetical protein